MKNFHVVLEAAWLVRDVKTADDAIGVAISEAGKRLNPKLDFVEVDVGTTSCPACGEPFSSVFIAANTALVGLIFEMKVFDAESCGTCRKDCKIRHRKISARYSVDSCRGHGIRKDR